MREPLKDRVRLEHILEATNNVARYMDGKTFEDIQADDMMLRHCLQHNEHRRGCLPSNQSFP